MFSTWGSWNAVRLRTASDLQLLFLFFPLRTRMVSIKKCLKCFASFMLRDAYSYSHVSTSVLLVFTPNHYCGQRNARLYRAAQMSILHFLGWCSLMTSKCPVAHGTWTPAAINYELNNYEACFTWMHSLTESGNLIALVLLVSPLLFLLYTVFSWSLKS